MTATGSPTEPLTYAIVQGLFGRPSQGKKLGGLLERKGLRPARSAERADVIIAHSAGCWLIPEHARARLVIWDGAPLAEERGRTFRQANLLIHKHLSPGRSIMHLSRNAYYGLRHVRQNIRIVRMSKQAGLSVRPGTTYVFITNRYDPWPRSKQLDEFLETKDWAFISMPGTHDAIWRHPEYYAQVIDHYARLLAEADHR